MLTPGMRVRVHFNLHKHDWSIVAMEGDKKGLVIARADNLTMTECTFKVSEPMRLKVVAKKCRSVHAWVHGRLAVTEAPSQGASEFNYNPYRAPTFTVRGTWAPLWSARKVYFTTGGKAYAEE